MILVITFVSVMLSCSPLLCSATYVNTSNPVCLESFGCPNFGQFKFPFYNTTYTRCGLIKINCTSSNGSIQLGGDAYEIIGKDYPGPSVTIKNSTFQKLLDKKSCDALVNNFTSPTPHLFSISLNKPRMTLFKCPKYSHYGAKTDIYFNQQNYTSYGSCKDHNFYYKYLISRTTPVPSDLPHSCQVIHLPRKVNDEALNYTNIFSLLTSKFSISFSSPSCNECRLKGHCHRDYENFDCSDAKKDKKLILILALIGSAFFIMLSAAVFIISHRYKYNLFSYISSKDESPNTEDGSFFFGVSVFSYAELEDATKNFDATYELGDGGFGAVYYGKLQDGREVAVKRLYDNNYKRVQHFMNEVEILTKLRHPHLVLLYGCTSRQSRELLLVYEYISNGTVADHLHGEQANPGLLTWPIRMKIAIETARVKILLDHTP